MTNKFDKFLDRQERKKREKTQMTKIWTEGGHVTRFNIY